MNEIEVYTQKGVQKIEEAEYQIQEAKHSVLGYQKAYELNISKYVEEKAGFKYLSWAYAVMFFRTNFPDGSWGHLKPYKDDTGWYVETWVKTHTHAEPIHEVYPVFEQRAKTATEKGGMFAIENPNAMQINKAIKRCLTKNIAMVTGIGLHLYAGEDLPEEQAKSVVISKKDMIWFLEVVIPDFLTKGKNDSYNLELIPKLIQGIWYGDIDINNLKATYASN